MIAVIGLGYVGQNMLKIFPDALAVDPPKGFGSYEDTAACELSIVCVPTPMRDDGSCDTSIVEDVVPQLKSRFILIRSTVTPGTCESFKDPRIVFAPEYLGESAYYTPPEYPQPTNPLQHGFMILGGEDEACSAVADLFLPRLGPCTRFRFVTSKEAEIIKYAENAFFAVKVTFSNQLRDICEAAGVNYHRVREGWIDDPRVGPMHSAAFKRKRGFDGKCLPKDTAALSHYCQTLGLSTLLLDGAIQQNQR